MRSPTLTQGRLSGVLVTNLSLTQLLAVSLCSFYPPLEETLRVSGAGAGAGAGSAEGLGSHSPATAFPAQGPLSAAAQQTNKTMEDTKAQRTEGRDGRRLCWESMDFCLTAPKDLC